mgnify:CR=1 FL=1|jgi:DNA-binding GntR family transcriptional regulator
MSHEKLKKSDLIARALEVDILRGTYGPGEKLRQSRIAESSGTSQVAVREALMQLVGQGLAVSLPRRGICVAPLDRSAVHELKVMREALEPVALLHSVSHLTATQIAVAEAARQECDAAGTVFEWEEANRSFHNAVIVGCGMPRLIAEVARLQLLYARHVLTNHASRWRPHIDRDHGAIMEAIRAKDAVRAAGVLRLHLGRLS